MPDELILTAGAAGSGTLILDWATSRRSTGYRVKILVEGEAQPRLFGLFNEDQTVVTPLPLGKFLTVTIIAHNDAGDSPVIGPGTITLA